MRIKIFFEIFVPPGGMPSVLVEEITNLTMATGNGGRGGIIAAVMTCLW